MTRLFANRTVAILGAYCTAIIVLCSIIALWLATGNRALAIPSGYSPDNRETSSKSDQDYRNSSNISREQYNIALAKWENLQISEYEATVQASEMGKWKIAVRIDKDYGKKYHSGIQMTRAHRILHYTALDSEVAELARSDIEFYSVGGLFDELDDLLDCQENSCKDRHRFLPSYFEVEFDQTMGYPRSITRTTAYATLESKIEDVKILK